MKDLIEKYMRMTSEVSISEGIFNPSAKVSTNKQTATVSFMVSANDEDEAKKKYKEMLAMHIKNGHIPKDTKIVGKIQMM